MQAGIEQRKDEDKRGRGNKFKGPKNMFHIISHRSKLQFKSFVSWPGLLIPKRLSVNRVRCGQHLIVLNGIICC